MTTKKTDSVSTEQAVTRVHAELSSPRRWVYRWLLALISIWVAAILSLWATEPRPLPLRLHLGFGCVAAIGAGWIGTLVWILTRRNCPSALDRIATAWMATAACVLFSIVSVAVACVRGELLAALCLALVGVALLSTAASKLRRAYALRSHLQSKLASLSNPARSTPAVFLLLVAVLCCNPVRAQDNLLTFQPTQIKSAHGETIEAQRGRLRVPAHHADPGGPTIEIAFVRVPGVDPQQPPTFVLAGGPGDSGIRVVRQMFMAGDRIRSVLRGDVIGIDQRGSGAAKPNLDVSDRYRFPLTTPGDPERYRLLMVKTCGAVADRLQDAGIDLTAFNTVENADDIDALRDQLGYKRMNLWGVSYGSQLALTVLKRHEDRINRVLLASPVGPDHLWKRPAHIQNCLARLAEDHPDLPNDMESVLAGLDDKPRSVGVQHPITGMRLSIGVSGFDVRLWTWHALGKIETLQQIPSAYRRMADGDFAEQAHWLARYRSVAGVRSAMNHLMDAASGCSPERRSKIEQETSDHLLGDVANFFDGRLKSVAWEVPDLGDDFRQPASSSRPVFVLCGDLDAKTPLENADEILSTLPNGRLAIIRGAGHGFRPREDVVEAVAAFFRGDALPEKQYLGKR